MHSSDTSTDGPITLLDDTFFMRQAIREARAAALADEVPVGAVVVCEGRVIARGHNQTERLNDVTAHAEMLALTSAANFMGAKLLKECTLYVTLEPCPMCAGALAWAQIGRIVYGAADERKGFMTIGKRMLHPRTKVEFGVMHDDCANILTEFFTAKRRTKA